MIILYSYFAYRSHYFRAHLHKYLYYTCFSKYGRHLHGRCTVAASVGCLGKQRNLKLDYCERA